MTTWRPWLPKPPDRHRKWRKVAASSCGFFHASPCQITKSTYAIRPHIPSLGVFPLENCSFNATKPWMPSSVTLTARHDSYGARAPVSHLFALMDGGCFGRLGFFIGFQLPAREAREAHGQPHSQVSFPWFPWFGRIPRKWSGKNWDWQLPHDIHWFLPPSARPLKASCLRRLALLSGGVQERDESTMTWDWRGPNEQCQQYGAGPSVYLLPDCLTANMINMWDRNEKTYPSLVLPHSCKTQVTSLQMLPKVYCQDPTKFRT